MGFEKNHIPWNKNTKGLMPTPWNKGKQISEELRKRVSFSCKQVWSKRNPPINCFKKGCKPWNKGLKGYRVGEKNNKWKGGKKKIICQYCGKEFTAYKGKYCSKDCYNKSQTGRLAWNKGKPNYAMRGKNHPRWKGGIGRHDPNRKRIESNQWREKVFKRDKYKCLKCGSNEKIQAHHIKKWSDYPRLRYVLNNGITLCSECHKKTFGKEEEYEKEFKELLKKAVNSGKPLTSKVEGNPEPSQESNFLEGATTRSRVLIGQ